MSRIVSAKIYPGIGIARVGNSPAEYFIDPEVPRPTPRPEGFYRGADGALKRQAARFRIYGLDRNGKVVRELTEADAEIEWTVHVANKKADWYAFEVAMDIPQAIDMPRRNLNVQGDARAGLIIDPGEKSITGQACSDPVPLDGGVFLGTRSPWASCAPMRPDGWSSSAGMGSPDRPTPTTRR
ncbi:MAG: hypothetical protein ACI8RZ_003233 [Myxococcota bacterium]|jgi:hypothetical protein